MITIKDIQAIQVIDSRGLPTISSKIILSDGTECISMVPSGASTGSREAIELRDGGKDYLGKGVLKAVSNLNGEIRTNLLGQNPCNQEAIDQIMIELDGTSNKENLGANAILAASLAALKAGSLVNKIPLYQHVNNTYKDVCGEDAVMSIPVPMLNIINGGQHASNNIDIQEFMIMPIGADSFLEGIKWSIEVYGSLKSILKKNHMNDAVGDEGGFAPNLGSNHQAIELIIQAIDQCGFKSGKDIGIALDCAASELFSNNTYRLVDEGQELSNHEFGEYLSSLVKSYPIISIEDGMDENDFDGWKLLTNKLNGQCQIVGDDLFVSNEAYLNKGIDEGMANSILIKYNQVGTITETLRTINMASLNKYKVIISHRSGETEDTTLCDLAVGVGAGQIKSGAPCRSDRTAKYNRLLWIEFENNAKDIPYANKIFI
tara:strand:- start:152 stop:1447 length:1296 start_codon:yes stop_codon:yes gene_type:complete